MSLLQIKNISKSFDGLKALHNLSFNVNDGEIVGVIGPNGAGKSTLFNAIMNHINKDSGDIYFDGINITKKPTHPIAGMGIVRTFQDSQPLPQISVQENLDLAFKYQTDISLVSVFGRHKFLQEEQQVHFTKIKELLHEVGLGSKLNVQAQDLSYGQGKLLEMLKVIASDARLILLDEPFSGLFPEMIKLVTKLIYDLSASGKTILLVEHNMQLIEEICDRVIVMDAGQKIADGDFKTVTKQQNVIDSYLGK